MILPRIKEREIQRAHLIGKSSAVTVFIASQRDFNCCVLSMIHVQRPRRFTSLVIPITRPLFQGLGPTPAYTLWTRVLGFASFTKEQCGVQDMGPARDQHWGVTTRKSIIKSSKLMR